jgi:biofilm PGA synthesis N-glycosyltransferase PgaC
MSAPADNLAVLPESSTRRGTPGMHAPRYVVISPAKDEQDYLEKTINSMVAQTVKPIRWVIVDDGSHDRTAEIAGSYAARFPWISIERIHSDPVRNPGPAVVVAFNAGLKTLAGVDYDFLVKLDVDLILPPDYFEALLARFENDEKLGIASGVYLEYWNKRWVAITMPPYHAAGASKVMRRQCFEQIEGYCPDIGWDSVDEIRARARGWNTRHFTDLTFQHLRQEGRGTGLLRNSMKLGVAYFLMGGGFFFMLFKIPYRMLVAKPIVLGGLFVLWGYLSCFLSGRKRLVNRDEARLYRSLLRSQLWSRRGKNSANIAITPGRTSN